MSNEQDGGNAPRAVDLKALDPHYVMPNEIKGDLDSLFDALGVVGMLAEAADHDNGLVVGLGDIAPLHQVLSKFGKRLMGDMTARFPTVRDASAI